eukprot:1191890-Prorocentrum_minimum.AAC.2
MDSRAVYSVSPLASSGWRLVARCSWGHKPRRLTQTSCANVGVHLVYTKEGMLRESVEVL